MIYRFARAILSYALGGFFRDVHLQGADAIPTQGPVLVVANHTNAFVDPLVLITRIRRPVTMTAKSTLSRNPLLAPLIWALGVILFHRRTDAEQGDADSARNVDAIRACTRRLAEGGALLIFPEGVSHSDPGMRAFKSGAGRIAKEYLADAAAPDLTIVPLGLHYTEKSAWRSEAVGLVGEAVSGRAWLAAHPDATAETLTQAMRHWIEALTLTFASAPERELVVEADHLFGHRGDAPEPLDRPSRLDAAERVGRVQRLQRGAHILRTGAPDRFRMLSDEARRLAGELRDLGVEPAEVALPMHTGRAAMFVVRELEVLVVGAVPAAIGWLVNLPPLMLLRALVVRLSVDQDHPASNAVFLSIPIIGLWWTTVLAAAAFMLPAGWLPVVAVGLPFTSAVHLRYRDRSGRTLRRLRTFLLWRRRPELREALDAAIRAWQEELRTLEPTLLASAPVDTLIRPGS